MAEAVKEKLLDFRYVALSEDGQMLRGRVRAPGETEAYMFLQERGYGSIQLKHAPSPLSLEGALPSLFRVKPREVLTFSRQLATLLESGVDLLHALQLLRTQAAISRPLRRVLNALASDLASGASFSQAVAKHPDVFDEIFSRTLSVGESTGKLELVLRQLADHREKQMNFSTKLSGALTYPLILFALAIGVSGILFTVVLPPLTNLFTTLNVALPLPTRMMIAISNFLRNYLLYLLLGMALAIPLVLWYGRQPRGRVLKERLRLRIPILGNLILLGELARFTRAMSVMLTAGLSLQEIMTLMPSTTRNSLFRDALLQIRQGLFLGQGLTQPMSRLPLFPPLLVQMVAVGEESNTLESNMRVLAEFYEATAEEKTNAMVSLITPMSTIVIGGLAGFVALSVIMPIYSITGAIK